MVDHCIHPLPNTPYHQPFPSVPLAYLDSLSSFNAFLFNAIAASKESPSLLFYQQSLHFPLRIVSSLSLSDDLCFCPPVLVTLLCHHNPLKLCATCTTDTVFQPHANILSWRPEGRVWCPLVCFEVHFQSSAQPGKNLRCLESRIQGLFAFECFCTC